MKVKAINRCGWTGEDALMQKYHDTEWGVPQFNDTILFEYIVLDAAQAGLSWKTVLHKRENYRTAFDNFEPEKIAQYTDKDRERLLSNPGIIRNKLKVESAITNAQAYLRIVEKEGSFHAYIWKFVDEKAIQNSWKNLSDIPAKTPEAEKMSKDLIQNGFKFVGPTICYAFMQAAGMVNDHLIDCFRNKEVQT